MRNKRFLVFFLVLPAFAIVLAAFYPHRDGPGTPASRSVPPRVRESLDTPARGQQLAQPPQIVESWDELLFHLRALCRKALVDPPAILKAHQALATGADAAVDSVLKLLLREPECLVDERLFSQELTVLLDELATSAAIHRFLDTIPSIDRAASASVPKSHQEQALILFARTVVSPVPGKAQEVHLPPLLALPQQLMHARVRRAVVEAICHLSRRLKDSRIRSLLTRLLLEDQDGETRAVIAAELSSTGDPALLGDFIIQLNRLSSSETSLAWAESRALALGVLNALSLSDGLSVLEVALRNSKNPLQAAEAGTAIAEAFSAGRFTEADLSELLGRMKNVAEEPGQVMYLHALQRLESKDPRILKTLKLAEAGLFGTSAVDAFLPAMATKGSAQDLLECSKRLLEAQSSEDLAHTVAGTLYFYLLRNPESEEVRSAMSSYAHSPDPVVRRRFVQNMASRHPGVPDFFHDDLVDLAAHDPDAAVRRQAELSLKKGK